MPSGAAARAEADETKADADADAGADTTAVGPAHSSQCDRRLSRAAREILRRDALPILRYYFPASEGYKGTGGDGGDATPVDLWDALRDALGTTPASKGGSARRERCLLDPDRDVFSRHELLTSTLPPARRREIATDGRGRPRMSSLTHHPGQPVHKCGLCGKTFRTRHYLDRHFDARHADQVGPPPGRESSEQDSWNDDRWVCPASDLCPTLGGRAACERVAFNSEPYYGRGSGGRGNDAAAMQRDNRQRMVEAGSTCRDVDMEASKRRCHQMFDDCFGEGGADDTMNGSMDEGHTALLLADLKSNVCNRLTCNQLVHSLAGNVARHIHQWREDWDAHHDHSPGTLGAMLVVALVIFYMWINVGYLGSLGGSGRGKASGRLLSTRGSKDRAWGVSKGTKRKAS